MKKFACTLLLYLVSLAGTLGQDNKPGNRHDLIEKLMQSRPEWFGHLLDSAGYYEIQVIYTQIDRDRKNKPHFTSYTYRLDKERYFYPASSVKLPLAVLALEKLNDLRIDSLTKDTPLRIGSGFRTQLPLLSDHTARNGLPTIAHFIRQVLLVSDNWAYNRLYEFVGQREIRERLAQKGLNNVRILHRFIVGDSRETSRHSNPFTFYQPLPAGEVPDGTHPEIARGEKVIYRQPAAYNEMDFFSGLPEVTAGAGYVDNEGRLVMDPFRFTDKNFFPLEMQQELLKRILFPESYPPSRRFRLHPDDYLFLRKYLSMLPRESGPFPDYSDTCAYWDSYAKFLMYGNRKTARIPAHIRIFNKMGNAYGYVTDNAYIVDFKNRVEFLLTATIATNTDGIYNDDRYDYIGTGYPFMEHLGRLIYEFELTRSRERLPNLEEFRIDYGMR
ncbi:beta-lactamase family protein [Anseongella ginsenosidimutans]|uniref:Beta-lactamase family protein n=1 Tax=Anseongella ginsenosidimutans TaxID=496056 RepID=A0A4R3KNJ6_9SPHI|nr:serine hydrolase [Anseongella ginsenosidimutans]QEC53677.1 serine hydrolase [Anseongella ginsenosidimutans]TCS86073.1 beta-lactamase family protein [Anseongella ginsenosidimutans]